VPDLLLKGAQPPAGQQALARLATMAVKNLPMPTARPSPETITRAFSGPPVPR